MDEEKRVVDAEFEVIRGPDEPPEKLPFWKRYRLYFDWRHGLLVAAMSLFALLPLIRKMLD